MDYQHMQQQQHMQIMETEITVSCFLELNWVMVFSEEYAGVILNEFNLFISFNLYSPDKIVRIRNWHRFSNPVLSGLKVGCQRVNEPVSYLFFINLRSTACGNDGANFLI